MSKRMIKAVGTIAVVTGFAAVGALLFNPAPVVSKGAVYGGKFYIAGHGGHIAVATVEIDPAADKPITIKDLDRIEIGTSKSHPFHDVRIDPANRNLLFYSTYKLDAEEGPNKGKLHVGSVDLKTEQVIKDATVGLDPRSTWSGANYCGSGQSKDRFLPVSMALEGYIDVFDKATLELKHRVFVDSLVGKGGYKFMHGNTSNDGKTFVLAVNKADAGWAKGEGGPTGELLLFLLDNEALAKGELKVLKKNALMIGNPKTTNTFRQYFTPDDKYILQSADDLFYVIDAKKLTLVAKENRLDGANHDALPTPDGKFAIMTLRKKGLWDGCSEPIQDGVIQLYDLENKKPVGGSVSVCYACHQGEKVTKDSILCGIEANWNK